MTRPLAFCCGLLLALPPGWCCFAAPAARAEAPHPAPAPCRDCCPRTPEQPQPPPEPVGPPPCPVCGERDLAKPDQPQAPADDLAAAPLPPAPVEGGVVARRSGGVVTTGGNLTRPLHVWHCVWTC